MAKIFVSDQGLAFLQGSEEEANKYLEETREQQLFLMKTRDEAQQRRLRDIHKKSIDKKARKDLDLRLVTQDIAFAFKSVIDTMEAEHNKKSPVARLKTVREKRYPRKIQVSGSHDGKISPFVENLGHRRANKFVHETIKVQKSPGIHDENNIQETSRPVVNVNPLFSSTSSIVESPGIILRSTKQKRAIPDSSQPYFGQTPHQIMLDAISDLESHCQGKDSQIQEQVQARLARFKAMAPSDFSNNCALELQEIQRLKKLLYKHSFAENKFTLRRKLEQKGRIKLFEKKEEASTIFKSAEMISNRFENISEELAVATKSKVSLTLLKEDLRKLKFIKVVPFEKLIGNFKLKAESSVGSQGVLSVRHRKSPTMSSLMRLPAIGKNSIQIEHSLSNMMPN